MRILPRRVEAAVGRPLLKMAAKQELKKSGLVPKQIQLAKSGLTMHYLERSPSYPDDSMTSDPLQTLVICHGMSHSAEGMAGFVTALNLPKHVRVIVPDAIGHGQHLKTIKENPETFRPPTPSSILSSTEELLDVLHVKSCHVIGYSMGGALAYFLKHTRPDTVDKTVLISPAFESVLDEAFVKDFLEDRKRHFCFESRADVKRLMRDLSSPSGKTKDPVPKFFLEAIYRASLKTAPPGHFKRMMHCMLQEVGSVPLLATRVDADPDSPRLVLWPDHDFICNYDKGKAFFQESTATEFVTLHDTGHMFDSQGNFFLLQEAPRVSTYILKD